MITSRHILMALVLIVAGVHSVRADDSVQRRLDQRVELDIDDERLARALRIITDRTGLEVTLSPDAAGYLPYGENTEVSLKLDKHPLRSGLTELCDELGMDFVVAGDAVLIVPGDPLIRLGRRATWDELKTLSKLADKFVSAGSDDYDKLEDYLQFRAGDDGTILTWQTLEPHLIHAGAGHLDDLLTTACAATGHTWYPWTESVVVLPIAEQTRRQLQRTVSLRFNAQPLADVLNAISQASGLRIIVEPQAIQQLPAAVRQQFTIVAEGVTAEQAILEICVATALGYRIEKESVVLHAGEKSQVVPVRDSRSRGGSDPIVGKVIIPSPDGRYTYEFFIRASDLSDAEERHRQELIRQATEALKRDLRTGLDD